MLQAGEWWANQIWRNSSLSGLSLSVWVRVSPHSGWLLHATTRFRAHAAYTPPPPPHCPHVWYSCVILLIPTSLSESGTWYCDFYKKKIKKKLETQFSTSLSAEAVVAYPATANVWIQVHVRGETVQLCTVSTRQKHGSPIACNVLFECSTIVCIYQSLFSIKYYEIQ
jgi:hypothetical protein